MISRLDFSSCSASIIKFIRMPVSSSSEVKFVINCKPANAAKLVRRVTLNGSRGHELTIEYNKKYFVHYEQ